MEVLNSQLQSVQQAAQSLGNPFPDARLSVSVLTTAAIPFLRICKQGLFDLKTNRFVDLVLP
jgi:adenine deaminase